MTQPTTPQKSLTPTEMADMQRYVGMTTEDIMIDILQSQKQLKQEQATLIQDVDYLKNEQPVNPSVCMELEQRRKKKVIDYLGGKESQAYKDRNFANSVFREAANDFKKRFKIPRYDLLKRKDETEAFDYWNHWEPSTNTKFEIRKRNSQLSLLEG